MNQWTQNLLDQLSARLFVGRAAGIADLINLTICDGIVLNSCGELTERRETGWSTLEKLLIDDARRQWRSQPDYLVLLC